MSWIKYRPEIDGLRTIAVMAVLIYHASFEMGGVDIFPGGFLGVDVFFVISGFLITSLLLKEHNSTGTISFKGFYARRFRRLLPGVFTVTAVTLFAGYFLLTPALYNSLADSALASLAFVSNIYWYFTSFDYGAADQVTRPLLHTWSLAVEEQYYLIFPAMLLILAKLNKYWLPVGFVVLLFMSFFYAVHVSSVDENFAFYMLPARLWELLAGSILAWVISSGKLKSSSRGYQDFASALGLMMVVGSFFIFSLNSVKHPGWITLIPVAGTLLLLMDVSQQSLISKLLASKPMVYIGLLSYSLYIWHYPVFIYGAMQTDFLANKFVWFLVTLVLSAISYHCIEKPLRSPTAFPKYSFLSVNAVFIGVLGLGLTFISFTNGASFRFDEKAEVTDYNGAEYDKIESSLPAWNLRHSESSTKCNGREPKNACTFGSGQFITLGDSFAGQYDRALLSRASKIGLGLTSITQGGCPYFPKSNVWFQKKGERGCTTANAQRTEVLERIGNDKIIFMSANVGLLNKTYGEGKLSRSETKKMYVAGINELLELGFRIVYLSGAPSGQQKIVDKWIASVMRGAKKPFEKVYDPKRKVYEKSRADHAFIRKIDHDNFIYVSIPNLLCEKSLARQCVIIDTNGSLYNSGKHLSYIGAERVIDSVFRKMTKKGWL